jgi:hypothetical protein
MALGRSDGLVDGIAGGLGVVPAAVRIGPGRGVFGVAGDSPLGLVLEPMVARAEGMEVR